MTIKTIADDFQDLILADMQREGIELTEKNIKAYKAKINSAFDSMVADRRREAEQEDSVSLNDYYKELQERNTIFRT